MNAAPALDLNLVRQHRQLERFRDMAHKEVDKLVDSLKEDLLCEQPLSIGEISQSFQEKKQSFLGDLLEDFIRVHHQELFEQEIASCPLCGKQVKRHADTPRTIETLLGASTISRPYFYCRDCRHGFFPVDEALELSRRKKQTDLQSLALEFLAEMPFERASELFEKATGISFSDHRMHDLFASFADEATIEDIVPSSAEIDRRIKQVAASQKRRPVLVVATDGAHTPTRPAGGRDRKRGPGEYREAKGFRIYLLEKDDIVQIASWHQIAAAEQIAKDLKLVAERIPTDKVRVCLIGDGAAWLWRAMQEAFPGAREVLDYYHCSEHIHALAQAQYADEPHKALLWVESTMARLSQKDGVRHVIGGLKRMQPKNADVKELIRKTGNYLENNKNRMNYRGARIGGYPVGSGGIESANKFICHTRIKRSGAWWLEPNCNSMLKLRCSLVNGTFEKTFSKHVSREKAKRSARNT
jgi:hypothetical protein